MQRHAVQRYAPAVPVLRLLPELEAGLRELADVREVSVVTGPDARPVEVHVLAATGKPPKQVVRDVQSLALARFGIELDHRTVSVVQLDEAPRDPAGATTVEPSHASTVTAVQDRPALVAVTTRTSGAECQVDVELVAAGTPLVGTALGPVAASGRARVVAAATLSALKDLVGTRCELESAQVVDVAGREVAVVVVLVTVPRVGVQVLTGSAPVTADVADAVARSVLASLNRHLAR